MKPCRAYFFTSGRNEKRDLEKGVQTYYSSPGPTPSTPKIKSAQTPGARATAILSDRNHIHNTNKQKSSRPPQSLKLIGETMERVERPATFSTNPKRGCPRLDRNRKTGSLETKTKLGIGTDGKHNG